MERKKKFPEHFPVCHWSATQIVPPKLVQGYSNKQSHSDFQDNQHTNALVIFSLMYLK